ncbi:thioester domain-containing protein [Halolactibacillus miurensis]|uniref:thioester domain-containing protein n=1 Tax=Halolactibacillus miurensis TaxID=306541 RepID=UPI0011605707|nr:thioester domain-containing protein [Halolactibacillus miurensis]
MQVIISPLAVFADADNKETPVDQNGDGFISDDELLEVTEEELDTQSLAVNEKGEVLYNGEPLYVGGSSEEVPVTLDRLMQEGVKQKLVTKKESAGLLSDFFLAIANWISPTLVQASDAVPNIRYNGSVSYSYSTVGDFTIDGRQAFCAEHEDSSPPTGTPFNSLKPYDNEKIQKALYYGWGGPGNLFSSRNEGIVVTSLVLSTIYSGTTSGRNYQGYKNLMDKVNNGSVPDTDVSLSDTNLSVSVKNGKQVSQSTTFQSDNSNSITINLPSGVTLVNESTNKSFTGSATIKGNQKFHLEASLSYDKSYSSGNLAGSMETYQPFLTKPKSGGYQDLITARAYKDPANTTSFSVPFKAQTVTMTKIYKDEFTGNTIDSTTSTVTIGSTYRACGPNELSYQGYPMIKKTWCSEGTVPNKNFTKTFWYNSEHTLKINYYNEHNGKYIKSLGEWTYEAGENYSKTVVDSFVFGNNDTLYKFSDTDKTISGTMGRGNKTIKVNYYPHHDIAVTWKNRYANYDVFKKDESTEKVGHDYSYDQPDTFTKNSLVYVRENNNIFSGQLGYSDKSHTFYYRLRRNVTVNYKDIRNGDVIKDAKSYDLVQGNTYSESPATIKNNNYTYRYVKHSGSSESGTIGTSDVTMTYHYDLPLAKVGLEKIQIYTAPSSKGLPVKVKLSKVNNYQVAVPDMTDSTKSITVALYQGSTKIDSKTYVAKNLPYDVSFTIPSNVLNKNENKPYTVKFEGYDTHNWDVINGQGEITTDGYTSSERTIQVNAATDDHLSYQGVVMTEREVGNMMKVFYETLDIPIAELDPIRTGYGFEMPIDMSYENDLGNGGTDFSFNMFAPMDIVDDTYVEYDTNGSIATVPLELTNNVTSTDKTSSKQLFELQHMNVERMTGHLFTDQQVAANDSRIEKEIISGDRKFYLPIWGYVGKYDFNVASDEKIGINQIAVNIDYTLDVVGHMYLHMDSPTKDKDAIHFEPINKDDPFPNGVPNNWTDEEVEAFYSWLEK